MQINTMQLSKIKKISIKIILIAISILTITSCGVGRMGYYRENGSYTKNSKFLIYKVKEGDTLALIASRYGVSTQEVAKVNRISNTNSLAVGQKIKIPGEATNSKQASINKSKNNSNQKNKDAGKNKKKYGNQKFAYKNPAPAPEIVKEKVANSGLQWPIKGVLYSKFGIRNGRKHDGVDISAPLGAIIRSSGDGKVLFSGEYKGYGNLILIGHKNEIVSVYAHNEKNLVKEGDKVNRGEKIASVGQTGKATGPHLHFEVRIGSTSVDPLKYLP